MAGKRIVIPNYMPALDINGDPVAGAKLYFYENETTTLKSIYTSAALTVAHPNPISANAAGVFASIFADEDEVFSVAVTDADNNPIGGLRNKDDVRPSEVYGADSAAAENAQAAAEEAQAAAEAALAAINAISASGDDAAAINARVPKNTDGSDFTQPAAVLSALGGALIVTPEQFGAVGDGTTNDTAAIDAALAFVSGLGGGLLDGVGKTYRIEHGDGNPGTDNITSNNVTIRNAAFISYNGAGVVPNNQGNQNYRVFQATGRSGLRFENLNFSGYCTAIALYDCEDVVIDGCRDDGQLTTSESNILTITAITQAAAGVVTYTGTDPVDQQFYTLTGIGGMTALENIVVKPGSIDTTAKTFVLRTIDGVNIDTTGYGAFTSGGIATLATNYMRDKSFYLDTCKKVVITGCQVRNFAFAVYCIGNQSTERCEQVIVTGCTFEHTTATAYTAFFPSAVYFVDIEDGVVSGCTFKNIYSSVVNGSTGNGMGFGVYEGDGQSRNLAITGNTFTYEASGGRTAAAMYISEPYAAAITGNTFWVQASANVPSLVRLDAKAHDTIYNVTGNAANIDPTSDCYALYIVGSATTTEPVFNVADNVIVGGDYAVRVEGLGRGSYSIKNNTFRDQGAQGIYFIGAQAHPHRGVVIAGNEITGSFNSAILMNEYCIQTVIENNRLLDGNRAALTGDSGSAVLFSSVSPGATIRGNTVGNSTHMVGFAFGFTHASATSGRIYKDITAGNVFFGLDNTTEWRRFATASPVHGLFDFASTDVVENTALSAGGVEHWRGIYGLRPEITANVAATAVIPITPGFASSFIAGQGVLITKSATPENGDFADTTKWHMSTVLSLDAGANTITLVDAIPAGDGTYVAGTAKLVFGYFRGSAAIAA